jgi:hypothetical protein
MKRLYKILAIAFVCVLALSALAVRTPRAVHAVVATFTKDVDNVDHIVVSGRLPTVRCFS